MRRGAPSAVLAAGTVIATLVLVVAMVMAYSRTSAPGSPAPAARTESRNAPAVGPVLAAEPAGARQPTPAVLARLLAGPLHNPRLGRQVAYSVVDASTGHPLAGLDAATPATPASVTKLTTAAAVLTRPGPAARITTRVVTGPLAGDVVLVGAGDPTLSVGGTQAYPGAARLDLLATAVRRATRGPVRRVLLDTSAYLGPATAAGWDSDLVSSGNVAPITALMVDGGRVDPTRRARTATPDLAAGRAFAHLLGLAAGAVIRGRASPQARELAHITSAPIATLVEQMLGNSDNVLAEALARQVAISRHQPASFAGAVAAVRTTLSDIGVPTTGLRLFDASGLSRQDLLPPQLLTTLLSRAAGRPQLRPLLTGLPIAGFTGTLVQRFRVGASRPGAGEVRAKTGTLSGVSALAGVVSDRDGRLIAFAILADRVPGGGTLAAESALDDVAATLSQCGCR